MPQKTHNSRIIDEVSKTSIELLLKEPFYSHVFGTLNKVVVGENHIVSTMGVAVDNKYHVLYINSTFWDEFLTEPKFRYGVVKHEILHIILKHTLASSVTYNRHIQNIAMDIVVNQYIQADQLPEESIRLDLFPTLELEPDQTWQYYYHKLLDVKNNPEQNQEAAQILNEISESSHGLDRHESWAEMSKLTELDRELASDVLDSILERATEKAKGNNGWGSLPGRIKEYLNTLLAPKKPVVSWRKVLKIFSNSSSKTKLKTTLKRPSKRYGTVPGIKIHKKQKVLVAIDTSGSVGKDDIELFFSEIFHIWHSGSEVQVTECDTDVHNVFTYRGKTPEFVTGRGGTAFEAPIQLANEEIRPDCLVYFTDGYAPAPKQKSSCPILWLITPGGASVSELKEQGFQGLILQMK